MSQAGSGLSIAGKAIACSGTKEEDLKEQFRKEFALLEVVVLPGAGAVRGDALTICGHV